jgi:hypothetical protein
MSVLLRGNGAHLLAPPRCVRCSAAVPLLDALRALAAFHPPSALPDCDPGLLGDVLEAHGLAPLASYQLEHTRLGSSAPNALRERLLTSYQGVVNDNLLKLVALRKALGELEGLRVVLLGPVAFLEWLYPHLAFRPVGDLRAGVAAEDGARLAERLRATLNLELVRTEHGATTAVFTDGTLTLAMQEGLWPGATADAPLFERATPYRVFGPSALRPSAEEAILSTVAEQALLGLHAPLVQYVDLRELLLGPHDAEYVRGRAESLRLSRALHGATLLVAHYFPETADAAARLRPELGVVERAAVARVVEAAKDPARLRQLRGEDAAARMVVGP